MLSPTCLCANNLADGRGSGINKNLNKREAPRIPRDFIEGGLMTSQRKSAKRTSRHGHNMMLVGKGHETSAKGFHVMKAGAGAERGPRSLPLKLGSVHLSLLSTGSASATPPRPIEGLDPCTIPFGPSKLALATHPRSGQRKKSARLPVPFIPPEEACRIREAGRLFHLLPGNRYFTSSTLDGPIQFCLILIQLCFHGLQRHPASDWHCYCRLTRTGRHVRALPAFLRKPALSPRT